MAIDLHRVLCVTKNGDLIPCRAVCDVCLCEAQLLALRRGQGRPHRRAAGGARRCEGPRVTSVRPEAPPDRRPARVTHPRLWREKRREER